MTTAPAASPAVIVHGRPHLRAVLAAGAPFTLLSAPGAGLYAGVGWWRALVAEAGNPPDILDCGDAPGRALEALRAGQRVAVLRAEARVWTDLADRFARAGGALLRQPPPALDMAESRAPLRLPAWLGVTGRAGSGYGAARDRRDAAMTLTPRVREILSWYESDNPGTKASLVRLLNHGKLAGTGKLVILPVDQGFEHGPARSFAPNPPAYDPRYHFQLAIDAGLNAYATVLGMMEAAAATYAGQIPTILKLNSSNSLATEKDQAVTGSVADALRLGCCAIGFTIYPGSEYAFDQMEELRELAEEAKSAGLAVVVWSYPRGPLLDKAGETALDICAYAAHMAALLGAHIIKVKPPTNVISLEAAKKTYETQNIPRTTMAERVRHVVQCCFAGRRIVIFSGGENQHDTEALVQEIRDIAAGGAFGSIIGRNTFQRPREEAMAMLAEIVDAFAKAPV